MRKSDAQENSRKRRSKKDIRRRVRAYRVLGVMAGLMTTATIMAAGYLAVNYMESVRLGAEPTLPAQVAPIDLQPQNAPSSSVLPESSTPSGQQPSSSFDGASDQEETSADETVSEGEKGTEGMSGSQPSSGREQTSKEPVSEPETEEESSSDKAEESAADEAEDRALRMKAIEKFDNLGIVVEVRNYLNLRTEPSTEAEICGKIFRYCGVNVLKDAGNGWYQVESGGVVGYVAQQYIVTGSEAIELALEHCRYQAEILPDTLDVLKKPRKTADVITTVKAGDRYDILSLKGDWAEIEAVEDLSGYVPVSDITAGYLLEEAIVFGYDDTISQTRIDLINKAFEYYGNPYVWAGDSLTDGIDCSGYTEQIYGMFGISLEDVSWLQAGQGKEVSEEDIRPGDLLFYVGRIPGQIGHVAIYIGNGKIIHAASESKGICVSGWKYVPIVTIRDVIGDR